MNNFILLHLYSNNKETYVAVDAIGIFRRADENRTIIYYKCDSGLDYFCETPEEIIKLIRENKVCGNQ